MANDRILVSQPGHRFIQTPVFDIRGVDDDLPDDIPDQNNAPCNSKIEQRPKGCGNDVVRPTGDIDCILQKIQEPDSQTKGDHHHQTVSVLANRRDLCFSLTPTSQDAQDQQLAHTCQSQHDPSPKSLVPDFGFGPGWESVCQFPGDPLRLTDGRVKPVYALPRILVCRVDA